MSVQQFLLGESLREMALAEGALGQRYVIQQLATAGGEPAQGQRQEYPDIDASDLRAFTHWCDPERALECLASAMAVTYEDIAAMSPEAQVPAVERAWRLFGLFFKYMNLNLYAWSRFRMVFEQALGTSRPRSWNTVRVGHDYWDARMGYVHGEPRPNGQLFASWRKTLAQSYLTAPGKEQPGRGPDTATFRGIGEGDVDSIEDEAHRVWLSALGEFTGYQRITPSNRLALFQPPGRQSLAWVPWTTTPGPFNADWRWAFAGEHHVGLPQIHLTMAAPLLWYWGLLFGKIPGLRVASTLDSMFPGPDPAPYERGNFTGAAQRRIDRSREKQARRQRKESVSRLDLGEDLSLAEYIMKIGPAALVTEMRRDVILHNEAIIAHLESRGTTLSMNADQQRQLDRMKSEAEQASTLTTVGTTLGLTLASIPTPQTMLVGAAIGAVSFVSGVVATLVIGASGSYVQQRDTFGRQRYDTVPAALGHLEFFRQFDPGTTGGLPRFLGAWRTINVNNSDIIRNLTPLNEILKQSEYVRAVLDFPAWLGPETFQGVPGYVPPSISPPALPGAEAGTSRGRKIMVAVLAGVAVATGIALWKREEASQLALRGWEGTKSLAARTGTGASDLWKRATGAPST